MPNLQLQQALQQLDAKDAVLRERANQIFLNHLEEGRLFLLNALKEKKRPVGKIALLLAALKVRDAVPDLVHCLVPRDRVESEYAEIVCALAELCDGQDAFDENLMGNLAGLKEHASPLVRGMSIKVYEKIGDLRSLDFLRQLAGDSSNFVKDRAAQALLRFAPVLHVEEKDVQQQIDSLSHPSEAVQASAVKALKLRGNPLAAMPLFVFIQSPGVIKDSRLRSDALRALANCLTGAELGLVDPLLVLAKEANSEIRAGTLLCLGRVSDIQGRSLQPIILGLLSVDKSVNSAAAIALSEGFRAEHGHLLRFLVDIYAQPILPVSSREALLIAFSRVVTVDEELRNRLRHLIPSELKSRVLNIRKTAIVVLEGLYDDVHPVPAEVVRLLRDFLFDKNKEIQIVSASFLEKYGLR